MDHLLHNDRVGCAECGAPPIDTLTCWDQLGLLIAWEYDDPELQAEHFLTVASYNLQHPAQFTDDAIASVRTVFIAYLDTGVALADIRRRIGRAFAGTKRVLNDERTRQPTRRSWRMTMGDVYIPDMPTGAAARVRAWAASIRTEL